MGLAGRGRRAARSAIAAVTQCEQTGAVLRNCAKTLRAKDKRAGIAVEIKHHRVVCARRNVPGDDVLAVRGIKGDLLRCGKLRGGRRRTRGVRKIQQLALGEIHQQDEPAEHRKRNDCNFQKRHGLRSPPVGRPDGM